MMHMALSLKDERSSANHVEDLTLAPLDAVTTSRSFSFHLVVTLSGQKIGVLVAKYGWCLHPNTPLCDFSWFFASLLRHCRKNPKDNTAVKPRRKIQPMQIRQHVIHAN
jgi:hypothetical protein